MVVDTPDGTAGAQIFTTIGAVAAALSGLGRICGVSELDDREAERAVLRTDATIASLR